MHRTLCPFLLAACLSPGPASADMLVAARTLRAQHVISAGDLVMVAGDAGAHLSDPAVALGLETRVVLYPGRPIRPDDLGPVALVERNQIVPLVYRSGALEIAAEGRALGRAGIGDAVRALNLASRSTVTGIVAADGSIQVGSITTRP